MVVAARAPLASLVAQARAHLELVERAERDGVDPPALPDDVLLVTHTVLDQLLERFDLSHTQRATIAILLAHEIDPRCRQLLRRLATEAAADPTTDVVRRVVFGGIPTERAWDELADDGILRRYRIIVRTDGSVSAPEHRQTLGISRRALALAHGKLALDPGVVQLATVRDDEASLDRLVVADEAAARIRAAFDGDPRLVVVVGGAGTGRRSLLAANAREIGRRVLTVEGRRLSRDSDQLRTQLRDIVRECRLFRLIPLVRDLDAIEGTDAAGIDRLAVFEAEVSGFALATATRAIVRRWLTRSPHSIELPAPRGSQRAVLWARALPQAGSGDADLLATLYPLAPALIDAVGSHAVAAAAAAAMTPGHVEAGLRSVLDDRLAGLARRVAVTQTWDDLVLPEEQGAAVVELLARIRQRRRVYEDWGFATKLGRGLGVTALFSGPPGTGKTMCAGLVARELGTELYQVDMSRISSKWLGETEKNLAQLFDAAEAGHAILLFDEADSLFGKRTDVRSSNDRHANQETNFLLQRLESFSGICILTTNHDAAIDEAFRRRLSVHLRLPVPDLDERKRLWSAVMPSRAPVAADLGIDSLADRYVMTGGYIRNAVLRAAFLAAEAGTAIDRKLLARAAQLEYEAMGKLVVS